MKNFGKISACVPRPFRTRRIRPPPLRPRSVYLLGFLALKYIVLWVVTVFVISDTILMSGRGQTVGDCGHRKGAYDDHLRCLSCAGCSISSTCNVCARWKQDTWAQVDRARTYKKRRTSKSSDASTPDVVTSPLPVPPVPACSSAASVSNRSGRSGSTRSRWDLFNVPTEPLLPVVCGPTESAIPVVTPVTTKGGSLSGAPAPPHGGDVPFLSWWRIGCMTARLQR